MKDAIKFFYNTIKDLGILHMSSEVVDTFPGILPKNRKTTSESVKRKLKDAKI